MVLLRTTKPPRVAQGLLAKALAAVVVQQTACKLVQVAVALEVPVAASPLQATLQTDSLAAAVPVRPQASQARQPLMQAVVVAQQPSLVQGAVVDWEVPVAVAQALVMCQVLSPVQPIRAVVVVAARTAAQLAQAVALAWSMCATWVAAQARAEAFHQARARHRATRCILSQRPALLTPQPRFP